MSVEQWRPVPGFPGYEVSDQGRVMSYRRKVPQVLRQARYRTGYLRVGLHKDDREGYRYATTTLNVHQLVMVAFVGPCPDGQEVRHLDGDPGNNHLGNLAYGTPAENAADILRHGRHWQKNKTSCRHGHAYDEPNTGYHKDGRRYCRACHRANSQRWKAGRAGTA